jgi:malonate decarboxylase gamma subunit
MELEPTLKSLFDNYHLESKGDFFFGTAHLRDTKMTILGTKNGAPIGVELLLAHSEIILDTIRNHPKQSLIFLIDTQGPKLRHLDELLGLNRYMAHMSKCIELARQHEHPTIGIVYGEAVSGGFITSGLFADQCYALSDALISVMNLPAMARIMKIPLEKLVALSSSDPVFAPGAENYYRMGVIQEIWREDTPKTLSSKLYEALKGMPQKDDQRLELGFTRGGRQIANQVVQRILKAG